MLFWCFSFQNEHHARVLSGFGAPGSLWHGLARPGPAWPGLARKIHRGSLDPSDLEIFFVGHAEESTDMYISPWGKNEAQRVQNPK